MDPQVATGKQKREDLEVVVRHAKEDLFANVKFICDPKVHLPVGGRIFTKITRSNAKIS
jgi:hypothetical protein